MDAVTLLLVYILAGVTLKAADVYGEVKGDFKAYITSIISAILFWMLLHESPHTATFMGAVIVGCIVSLKVNRPNLIIGLVTIVALSATLGFQMPIIWLLAILSSIAYLDEFTHDRTHKWKSRFRFFFKYRGLLKATAIFAALTGIVTPVSAVGFLLFDVCYDLSGICLERQAIKHHS
jgi:multisubunit Na+/H+ antiporter MnhE subunit